MMLRRFAVSMIVLVLVVLVPLGKLGLAYMAALRSPSENIPAVVKALAKWWRM